MRPFRRVPALLLVTLAACGDAAAGAIARDVRIVPVDAPRSLTEASSASMSREQPGVLFTINDSGNEPLLYALDTTGHARGIWRITGATNVDWEATAIAPCAPGDARPCVYIADTGDNMFDRPTYTIYRVQEPAVGDSLLRDSLRAERIDFSYGGEHVNVEAMYVGPRGDIYLIEKLLPKFVPWMGSNARMFVIHGGRAVPFLDSTIPLTMISDAALSPDAHHVVIRTPKVALVFEADSASGRINPWSKSTLCRLTILRQHQGEGVSWVNDAGRMVFTSEGRGAPLNVASCPLPGR
jgi:hypothetical protein